MLGWLSHGESPEVLLRLVIGVSPWLAILFCVAALSTALRGIQVTAGAALALLSVLPFPYWMPAQARHDRQQTQADQAYAAQQAKLEAIRNLPDDTPVEKLLAYTDVPDIFTTEMPEEARARIRKLSGRQAQVQALLERGSDLVLTQLDTLDLDVTPSMCAAARKNLARAAAQWQANTAQLQPAADRVVGPIRFLLRHGCACDNELDALQQALQSAPDSWGKDNFLKQLAAARATRGAE